jgi:ABC-type sugar transport system substrate-binding protein
VYQNLFGAIILGFLAFASTAESAETPAQSGRYIFVLTARNNPYWDAAESGIKEVAKARGLDVVVYRTEDATAAEEQLNTCLTAIEQHPKVIAMAAVTSGVGLQCMKKAVEAGIIVADLDSNITVEQAGQAAIPLAFSVGSNNTELGATAGDYAATLVPQPAPHILVLEGAPGSVPGNKRVAGFRDRLKDIKPDAVVTSLSANWDTIRAMNTVNDVLQRDPALNLIFAANDTMALGAAEAVKSAGKTGEIKIIGIDGIEAARKAIMSGALSASVAQLPYLMGKRAAELAMEAVATGKTGITEATPVLLLTKQSLEAKTDSDLQYVR